MTILLFKDESYLIHGTVFEVSEILVCDQNFRSESSIAQRTQPPTANILRVWLQCFRQWFANHPE